MYGLIAKSSITRLNICQILMRLCIERRSLLYYTSEKLNINMISTSKKSSPHCVAVSFAATTCSLMHFLISRTMIELLCCHYYYYFACLPSARANYFYELVQLFLSSSAFGVFRDHSLANLSQGTSFVLILIYIW